jgi:hypothetical protein
MQHRSSTGGEGAHAPRAIDPGVGAAGIVTRRPADAVCSLPAWVLLGRLSIIATDKLSGVYRCTDRIEAPLLPPHNTWQRMATALR